MAEDSDESLDEILSPSVPEPEGVTTEAEPEAQPRDEHGRFAPKSEDEPDVEAEPVAEGDPEPEAEHEHTAPVAAVVAERRKAQAANERADKLERDLAEMRGQMSVLMQRGNQPQQPQPKPEPVKPPELWEDPNAWVNHQLTPVQQELANLRFETSRNSAFVNYGKDTVEAAENAMKQAIERGEVNGERLAAALLKSRDPVGDVVRWHENSPAVREASMRDKLKAEIMAELGIDPSKPPQPVQPSQRAPVVKIPPNLNRVPAGHSAPERDESLDEVLSVPRRRA